VDFALLGHGVPCQWNHSLYLSLASLWLGTQFDWLGLFTGKVIATILLMFPLAWVTYHVYRCPARRVLTYPYLLWIVALATYMPPISNDYNLVFLPLAVLTVWDRRDPLFIHVALALLFLWWQPIRLSIGGLPLMAFKFFGLYAVAFCLVRRANEQSDISLSLRDEKMV
jgi:hypothetical protein